jgi:hypothetical protein
MSLVKPLGPGPAKRILCAPLPCARAMKIVSL